MLEMDWNINSNWSAPSIVALHDLSISPASSAIHYAVQCFEGMKAFIDDQGHTRLFRPMKNMERFLNSSLFLDLPGFDKDELLKCLIDLVKIDKDWIPRRPFHSLYIRPTAISTFDELGVRRALKSKIFTILSPVGPYYPRGFVPVKLYTDLDNVRAWPHGCGDRKLGSNYGPTIRASRIAESKGYDQILWLVNENVTECGTMNLFFFWKNKHGEEELITAALDGTILPGVVRDSVLCLAREWGQFKVAERSTSIHEIVEAIKEGRMIEAFGCGTAANIAPISLIHFSGKDYIIPVDAATNAGKLAKRLTDSLVEIQYGKKEHEWSVRID